LVEELCVLVGFFFLCFFFFSQPHYHIVAWQPRSGDDLAALLAQRTTTWSGLGFAPGVHGNHPGATPESSALNKSAGSEAPDSGIDASRLKPASLLSSLTALAIRGGTAEKADSAAAQQQQAASTGIASPPCVR
jgi:hypothetical protein